MRREVDLKEISDGRLYGPNDMVKADCQGCEGCSACCHGMGGSIILDPLDVFRLEKGLQMSFEQLLAKALELRVVDGIILPNLKMAGHEESCTFLNDEGRCSVHPFRPGVCRLFPLGRVYDNGSFWYFLQTHECLREERVKVKVRKWIDTPNLKSYEAFVTTWHYFLKELEEKAAESSEQEAKELNMKLLCCFYLMPYRTEEDFYPQFEERLAAFRVV